MPRESQAADLRTDTALETDGCLLCGHCDGLGANEPVAFTATDPNGRLVDMGTAQSDASGNVTYSFVLSSEVPGIDTEQATGQLCGMYAFTTDVLDDVLTPCQRTWPDVGGGTGRTERE